MYYMTSMPIVSQFLFSLKSLTQELLVAPLEFQHLNTIHTIHLLTHFNQVIYQCEDSWNVTIQYVHTHDNRAFAFNET